jgi:hypothetical protein
MIRGTSLETYNAIVNSGLLSAMRLEVYKRLYYNAHPSHPVTAGELAQYFAESKGGRGQRGNISARLCELRELGVATEWEPRKCKITGRRAITWATNDNLPRSRMPEKMTHTKVIAKQAAEIETLKKRVDYLEGRLDAERARPVQMGLGL